MTKKNIPGQMSLAMLYAEPMSLKDEHFVVQSNKLITGQQALNLNSAKLIRAAIMQIKPDDEELKPYFVTVPQLAKLLNVSKSNLYRDTKKITDNINKNPVYMESLDGKKWVTIPWVQYCEYDEGSGFYIQLNERLKPFLLALKEKYTQYRLETITEMKSVYAIRLFELIQEKINRTIPKAGIDAELIVDDIRKACNCENKYTEFKHFRERVIDAGEAEINRCTFYTVTHTYIKTGRNVTAIRFHVERF